MTAPPADQLSVAEHVDAACDRFEAEHNAGRAPALENFLAGGAEPLRLQLFRGLLELELELRKRRGDSPQPSHYNPRFPEYAAVIDLVFADVAAGLSRRTHPRTVAHDSSVNAAAADTSRGPATIVGHSPPVEQIARFQIVQLLGEGAFGAVYRARDPQLDRDVAVKVPQAGALSTREDRERFLREARAAAGLHHPHICPVHEVGTTPEGRDYIVMAFIEGKTLSAVLQSGQRLSERQIANAIRKLALALEEAHEKGVIHRDLKPANIMINRRGEPVIMDFGLARRSSSSDPQLSHSGQIMGTPAYMSPEQARGDSKAIGPASDIYSLGIVMYEMLCGKRPFSGTVTEVIGQILHVPAPSPSQFRPEVDPRLQAICLKAIAKQPGDRYASMKDFAAALAEYAKSGTAAIPTASATTAEPPADDEPLHTKQLARLVAAVSTDVEDKIERAARRVVRQVKKTKGSNPPFWAYLAGSGLIGVIVLLGILFFVRKDTVTVIVNIPINIKDPALSFLLDEKPVSAEQLAAPIELQPGEHELIVNKDSQLFKRFVFKVGKGANEPVVIQDATPKVPAVGGTQSEDDELARWQGKWRSIAEDIQGRHATNDELAMRNHSMLVEGNRRSVERTINGKPEPYKGTFRLNPAASTKEFDFDFDGTSAAGGQRGLYEFEGPRLRLIYRSSYTEKPPRAAWSDKGQPNVIWFEFERFDAGWIELLNGQDLSNWIGVDGKSANWKVEHGYVEVAPRQPASSILTREKLPLDFELHVEFWVPNEPSKRDQARGNSGVYLHGRHEIQICDGYQNPISKPATACGALFGLITPFANACTAPETWQTFDIIYHSPRVDGQQRVTTPGHVTVIQNGRTIIDHGAFSAVTGTTWQNREIGQPGPIMLQDHGSKVRFRNLRFRPFGDGAAQIPNEARSFNGHAYKFFPEQLPWKTAKARCEALGGHLVILETAAENAFVAKLVEESGRLDTWIGATDEGAEGQWRWVNGELVTWTNWFQLQKQPNNKGGAEHFCVMSNQQLQMGQRIGWTWCDQPNVVQPIHQPGYVCEWDAATRE